MTANIKKTTNRPRISDYTIDDPEVPCLKTVDSVSFAIDMDDYCDKLEKIVKRCYELINMGKIQKHNCVYCWKYLKCFTEQDKKDNEAIGVCFENFIKQVEKEIYKNE